MMRLARYSILSVIGLVAFAAGAYAQTYDVQSPFPATQPLYGVSSSGSVVYAVGDRATVLKSADGSTNWSRILNAQFQPADRFNATVFLDQYTGFVFGTSSANAPRVFKTTDGGSTMTSSTSGIGALTDLRAAAFPTASHGWVVGKNVSTGKGAIYNTVNTGASWASMTSGIGSASVNYGFNDVSFYNDSIGCVVGTDNTAAATGVVYVTTNIGNTWAVRSSANFPASCNFRSVCFTSATNGFLVGQDVTGTTSLMMQTFDQGQNWTRVAGATITRGNFSSIRFLAGNPLIGWAVGDSTDGSGLKWQVILATVDGGLSWQRQDFYVTPGTLNAIRVGSALAAWGVGNTKNQTSLVMNYIGSGIWYQQSRSLGTGVLNNFSFISRTVGYATGNPYSNGIPQLMRTQNAGFSWTSLAYNGGGLVAGSKVNAVQFFNPTTGWVAGQNSGRATMLQTRDGGSTWTASPNATYFPASAIFNCMKWQDVVTGFVGGATTANPPVPLLYYTGDAGASWTAALTAGVFPANGSLTCMATRPGLAYAGGGKDSAGARTALLLRSTDFGVSWTRLNVAPGSTRTIYSVFAQSLDSTWICGSDASGAFVQYTTNGSSATPTWQSSTTINATGNGAGSSLNGIYFITPLIGFAVGQRSDGNALVVKTIDGGVTWNEIDPQLPVGLNAVSVFFSNQADIWAAGANESIIHTVLQLPLQTSYPTQLFVNVFRPLADTAVSYFAIGNSGTSTLTLNLAGTSWKLTADAQVPADYTIDSRLNPANGTFSIPPGVVDSFKVVFSPHNYGPRTGTLYIPSNSARGDTVKIRMGASGSLGTVSFATTPLGIPFPLSMHDDTVLVGQFLDDSLFITNTSTQGRLNIKAITLSGVNAEDYSIVRGISAPIAPGAQDTLIVRFTPLAGYNRYARIDVATDAPGTKHQLVLLNGFGGCAEDGLTSVDTMFVGTTLTVGIGPDSAMDSVTICNTCALPVNIISQSVQGLDQLDFKQIDSLPTSIMPGECATTHIVMRPFAPFSASATAKDAQFVIRTNARTSGNLVRQLSGHVCSMLDSVNPATFAVGLDSASAATATHESAIWNSGVCDMRVDSMTFVGDPAYTVVRQPLTPLTLKPGASDTVSVKCTASTGGVKTGTMYIWTNSTNRPQDSIVYMDTVTVGPPVSVREHGMQVTSLALQQNYPNPFNPTTLVRYAVPSRQHVTVRVLNALGVTVAVLANEMHEAGQYHATFDASNLQSGTYFCELRAGGTTISRSMTLLK